MNLKQLSIQLSKKLNLSLSETRKLIKAFLDFSARSLSKEESLHLSPLGTFSVSKLASRTIAHPKNPKKKLLILERAVPRFKISSSLKEKLIKTKISPQEKSPPSFIRVLNIPYIDLTRKTIPKEVLLTIPEQVARRWQVVPVEVKDGKLMVAMIDPEDREALEFLKKETGKIIEPRICTSEDLNHVLDQYSGLGIEVEKIAEEVEAKPKEEIPPLIEISETAPAAKIISSLLRRAVRNKASDIHIEPEEKTLVVRFRIDGILHKIVSLPKDIGPAIISRVKILSNLKIDETRLPQDGRFQTIIDRGEIDFRVSTLPTANGEKTVLRILDKSTGILTLEQLGLAGKAKEILEDAIHKTHGMSLVCGPTGSGKTTTLYAILDRLSTPEVNIVTLEDPIEYRLPEINQSQVNPAIGYTFANGLRSIVRQDPDIIMLGEIRDYETANMAIHAALTGHIVLSTLHTNDAAGAIPRLIDMKVEPFLITSSVNAIISQRLTRKICQNCKEKVSLSRGQQQDLEKELGSLKQKIKIPKEIYRGKGCSLCNQTGYKGRIGIFEILAVSEDLKSLVISRVSSSVIAKDAIRKGMITLKQDGILKALEGITTLEEVWRVTRD